MNARLHSEAADDTVIVHGPELREMTRHAYSLLRHFGLRHLHIGWQPGQGPPAADTLVITSADLTAVTEGRDSRAAGVRVLPYDAAMRDLKARPPGMPRIR